MIKLLIVFKRRSPFIPIAYRFVNRDWLSFYKMCCERARSLYVVKIVLQVFIVVGFAKGRNNEASYFTNGLSNSQFTKEENEGSHYHNEVLKDGQSRTAAGLENGPRSTLTILGVVELKAYLGDTALRNWTQARSYCEDISMQLATVTTVPQAKFLESVFKSDNISGLYWTAGWDKNRDGNFKWDKTEDKIPKFKKYPLTILQNEGKDEPQCLAYSAGDNKSFVYFKMGCNKELFTLCETLMSNKTISGRFVIIVTEIICIIFAYLLLRLCLQQLRKQVISREKQNRVLAASLIISDE